MAALAMELQETMNLFWPPWPPSGSVYTTLTWVMALGQENFCASPAVQISRGEVQHSVGTNFGLIGMGKRKSLSLLASLLTEGSTAYS